MQALMSQFKEQVALRGEKTAVLFHDQNVTYAQLDKWSDQCAIYLNQQYTPDEVVVPFMLNRSVEMLVVMLAILKTGRAFLPLDPNFPVQRIQTICAVSDIQKIVCDSAVAQNIDAQLTIVPFACADVTAENTLQAITDNELAYILFTSGSSGTPKGVQISQQALNAFVCGIAEIVPLCAEKNILATTTIGFDIAILETLVPLLKGMTIVLADESVQKSPKRLIQLMQNHHVTTLQMTPSHMNLLLTYGGDSSFLQNIHEILLGGEPLPLSLLQQVQSQTNATLYNMYGPTEATIWCAAKQFTPNDDAVTIGQPFGATQIYIVDEDVVQADGDVGEILIGGTQLACGYVQQLELTHERFVALPTVGEGLFYRTGDKGHWLPNGEIEFLGRLDNQIKLHGHRIELEEIEQVLLRHPQVAGAGVVLHKQNEIDGYLCGYVVAKRPFAPEELPQLLASYLPDYMIPSQFVFLDTLPLSPNGKMDRQALRALSNDESPKADVVATQADPVTEQVRAIIVDKCTHPVELSSMYPEMLLRDLGVNSIALVGIIVAIEDVFDFEVSDEDLFSANFQTIQDLTEYVHNKVNET